MTEVLERDSPTPLILCMENANGEDVALKIEPNDDFESFLNKAKSLLGFEVDINSITRNKQVNLTDNIYEFLMNAEKNEPSNISTELNLDILEENASSDFVYMLDDGTQINASQIQFDNDEPEETFNVNTLPFVKRIDTADDEEDNKIKDTVEIKQINIESSPLRKFKHINPKKSFASTLPFRVLPNKAKNFEAQVNKFLVRRPATVLNNISATNYNINVNKEILPIKSIQQITYTREQVLDLVKDSPLATNVDNVINTNNDIRRHTRKTDPCKPVPKKIDNLQPIIKEIPNKSTKNTQMCLICEKYIDRVKDKLYLFDKEDQKHHRSLRQTKQTDNLKVICEKCLKEHFRPGVIKDPELTLEDNEFLVVRNNQQFVFKRNIIFNKVIQKLEKVKEEIPTVVDNVEEEVEFVKVVTETEKEIPKNDNDNDDVIVIKEEYQSEPEETNSLDEIDENLEDFLGKYQEINLAELKCRFCQINFQDINCVIEHGTEHKHDIVDDGQIFPCPLCDYGYGDYKWLRFHISIAHDNNVNKYNSKLKKINEIHKLKEKDQKSSEIKLSESNDGEIKDNIANNEVKKNKDKQIVVSSPIAKRTRSSINKKKDNSDKENPERTYDTKSSEENNENDSNNSPELCKNTLDEVKYCPNDANVEVKSEPQDKSDSESIWILEAEELTDNELCNDNSLRTLENKVKPDNKEKTNNLKEKCVSCGVCNQIVTSKESLKTHKCTKKRGRKRKSDASDDVIYIPNKDNEAKINKKNTKEYKRDSQVMSCHNCNETFTSKVRLKFHMQFHEKNCLLRHEDSYKCSDCKVNKVFSTENALFDHVHFDHPKQKRWQCPVKDCGKTFYLRATLTKHSRSHTDTRRYACPSCGKRFFDKQTLDEHGVTHLKIKPYQCHICLKQLTRRSRLRMHLRAHEEELSPAAVYVCRVCARAFKDHNDAEEHGTSYQDCINMIMSPNTELSPTTGLLSEQTNIQQLDHIFTKHKIYEPSNQEKKNEMLNQLSDGAKLIINVVEIEKAFRCEYCEEVFYLEDNLNNHRNLHKNVKNPFTCHICKVSFATYSRCTTHKTTHGFYKRPLAFAKNNAELKDTDIKRELLSASGILGYGGFPVVKHFLCEDCGRSYLHWTYLQVHRRMKHPRNALIHQCSLCQLIFPNSWSVSYHKKKVHGTQVGKPSRENKDYWIPCRDCEEFLPNKKALYKHRSREHCNVTDRADSDSFCNTCEDDYDPLSSQKCISKTKNKYYCLVCGNSFRTVTQRNEHLRIHTGEKPFTCKECGVCFRKLSSLRNHRQSHRVVTEVPTYMHLLLEIPGLNPTAENVIQELNNYNIKLQNIVDISKISFKKDDIVEIPESAEKISQLLETKTEDLSQWKTDLMTQINIRKVMHFLDSQREQSSTTTIRNIQPNNEVSCNASQAPTNYPITLNIPGEEKSDVNLQLLLREGVVVNGSQMVPVYPNYPFLPESTADIINSDISIEILQDIDKSSIIDIE